MLISRSIRGRELNNTYPGGILDKCNGDDRYHLIDCYRSTEGIRGQPLNDPPGVEIIEGTRVGNHLRRSQRKKGERKKKETRPSWFVNESAGR